jgi:DNA-binding PadR family transcriptional regulator
MHNHKNEHQLRHEHDALHGHDGHEGRSQGEAHDGHHDHGEHRGLLGDHHELFDERSELSRGSRPGWSRALRIRGGAGHGHGHPRDHFRGMPPRRGGRRQRRGDVRAAVLVLLEEEPRNGYQLIQELAERSNEAWRPSPGSIYPVLQQLEDEGLVAATAEGTGRTYALTEQGRALVNEQRDALGKPWESAEAGTGEPVRELMGTAKQVMLAARQVVMAGSEAQITRATAILVDARRSIYGILAEDDQA